MFQKIKLILFIGLIFQSIQLLNAQNFSKFGRYKTNHFGTEDFAVAPQFLTGIQGKDGNLYFGNKSSIVSYNGVKWEKLTTNFSGLNLSQKIKGNILESKTGKLFLSSTKNVFVGRYNNLGYINYSDSGKVQYNPIYQTFEHKKEFGNIWNIFENDKQQVIFIAENSILSVDAKTKKVKEISKPKILNGLICQQACELSESILLIYRSPKNKKLSVNILLNKNNFEIKQITIPPFVEFVNLIGSIKHNNSWLVADIRGTIYKVFEVGGNLIWSLYQPEDFKVLTTLEINSFQTNGKHILVGTKRNGLLVFNDNGKLLRSFSESDELVDLYVHTFFFDHEYNIWLCLDNGIQVIETSNPVSVCQKKEGIQSTIERINISKKRKLLATHNELTIYKEDTVPGYFNYIKKCAESTYDIGNFKTSKGNKYFIISDQGIHVFDVESFQEENSNLRTIAFRLIQNPINKDEVFFTCEEGLGKVYRDKSDKWVSKIVYKTKEIASTFSLSTTSNLVFFEIRNKGICVYNPLTLKSYIITPPKKYLTSNLYTSNFQGEIIVGLEDAIGVLDLKKRTLIPILGIKNFMSKGRKQQIHRLCNINNSILWTMITPGSEGTKNDFEFGWIEKKNNAWSWNTKQVYGLKGAGIVFDVSKDQDQNYWIGTNNGLYFINEASLKKAPKTFEVVVDEVIVNDKTFLYRIDQSNLPFSELDYNNNSFKLIFHCNSFIDRGKMEYRYKLKGYIDNWSDWSKENVLNFSKISEGTYTIQIQGRNYYGETSSIYEHKITILPPWYRTIWAYLFYIIAFIALVYAIVQLALLRVKQQNQKLEETVQERTKEIAEQNKQLEHQKEEIEEKTKDILDSIQYAKRIQTTILPSKTRLKELFKEHFVLYLPKDIVSGDFYWAREINGTKIFAAVDCTGHGVPGSLVSIVGNNGLLRAVNEFKLVKPNEILDRLREIVIEAFKVDGQGDVKDGMDIALCAIDETENKLYYAGANNECVIIRNGEIIELKADKQPIGQFIEPKPFTLNEFDLEIGDCIYVYTDGYVDQFGGEKGKKFKSRPFKEMLVGLNQYDMERQLTEIHNTFNNWVQGHEQIDDVCVFGVKYSGKA